MTKVDLQRVLDLDAHATEGPWLLKPEKYTPNGWKRGTVRSRATGESVAADVWDPDGDFITECKTAAPAMAKALQAVLEIHERMEHGVHHYGLQEHPDWCAACSEPESGISIPYPCQTVRSIHYHLGEQE